MLLKWVDFSLMPFSSEILELRKSLTIPDNCAQRIFFLNVWWISFINKVVIVLFTLLWYCRYEYELLAHKILKKNEGLYCSFQACAFSENKQLSSQVGKKYWKEVPKRTSTVDIEIYICLKLLLQIGEL